VSQAGTDADRRRQGVNDQPVFPPLLRGEEAGPGDDPLASAIDAAKAGTDAGLVMHRISADHLAAALILAPEVDLADAMAMALAAGLGAGDALGALGPPELAFHFVWPGGFAVNGAACGGLRVAAADTADDRVPDWLVIGIDLPLWSGEAPLRVDETSLFAEGLSDVSPLRLLEAWARHTLVWIHRWSDEGLAPLHAHWLARTAKPGDKIAVRLPRGEECGVFVGLDDRGGLLLKRAKETVCLPLTEMLEPTC
ncbi:MAG: biotin/lipoate--protein ligase family protein, partial [Pseudomonadota bacterium]